MDSETGLRAQAKKTANEREENHLKSLLTFLRFLCLFAAILSEADDSIDRLSLGRSLDLA